MDTSALHRAIEKRMLHDFAQSKSIGNKARVIRSRVFREVNSLPKGDANDATLTPLQQRIHADVDEIVEAVEALFSAFDRPLKTENADDDPVSTAVIQLLGPLLGRILELELRVGSLEAALD